MAGTVINAVVGTVGNIVSRVVTKMTARTVVGEMPGATSMLVVNAVSSRCSMW